MMEHQKIKVVFSINDFIIGGVQRLYLELFTYLDSDIYDIHLISLIDLPGKVNMYADIPASITVHRLAFTSLKDIRNLRALRLLLKELAPDVIITSLFFSNTVVRLAVLGTPVPVIAVEQNTNTWKTVFQVLVDRILAIRTTLFIASSKTVKDFASRQMHLSPDRFVVVHNSIDTDRILREKQAFTEAERYRSEFGIQPGDKVAVNVARLTQQKNQPMLIEAFARFAESRPEWKLLIVGEGPDKAKLEALIHELHAEKAVMLVGARSDIFAFYFISTLFVSTSFIEGFGIAHAEALAAGLPVLTTRTAGPDEMVEEGVTGHFVEVNVESILEGFDYMASTGVSGSADTIRGSVARFDSREIAAQYARLIERTARS